MDKLLNELTVKLVREAKLLDKLESTDNVSYSQRSEQREYVRCIKACIKVIRTKQACDRFFTTD